MIVGIWKDDITVVPPSQQSAYLLVRDDVSCAVSACQLKKKRDSTSQFDGVVCIVIYTGSIVKIDHIDCDWLRDSIITKSNLD